MIIILLTINFYVLYYLFNMLSWFYFIFILLYTINCFKAFKNVNHIVYSTTSYLHFFYTIINIYYFTTFISCGAKTFYKLFKYFPQALIFSNLLTFLLLFFSINFLCNFILIFIILYLFLNFFICYIINLEVLYF